MHEQKSTSPALEQVFTRYGSLQLQFTLSPSLCIIARIMSGGNVRRLQDARKKRAAREARKQASRPPRKASELRRTGRPRRTHRNRARRNERRQRVLEIFNQAYQSRRLLVGSFSLLAVVALFLAILFQSPGAADPPLPIDPNEAPPDVQLAEAEGLQISTPIRPADVSGLGYHPDGEEIVELQPRGKNLSANPLLGIFNVTRNPGDVRYYVMDREGRDGPITGALDVGADAGARVYAPVTGVVTAVLPDPTMQNANIVEIKPADSTNTRVYVSLIQDVSGDIGPDSQVTAGTTDLGSVADLASVLEPQLAEYTNGAGNHVTVTVLQNS